MNGVERGGKWKTLRERLGFKGIGCCGGGAIWGFGATSNMMRMREEEEEEEDEEYDREQDLQENRMLGVVGQIPVENSAEQDCVGQIPVLASGINLAMALAAERHFRAAQDWDNGGGGGGGPGVGGGGGNSLDVVGTTGTSTTTMNSVETAISNSDTPLRVSLMRLLEDGDVVDGEEEEAAATEGTEGGGGGEKQRGGNDVVCCVCMGRKKGAAFIPCGHTFCRVCSRELWLNRGSCPLCNRSILEILDIF